MKKNMTPIFGVLFLVFILGGKSHSLPLPAVNNARVPSTTAQTPDPDIQSGLPVLNPGENAAASPQAAPGRMHNNLIQNGDFSEGLLHWEKTHGSNVDDVWRIAVTGDEQYLSWSRERSRNDGGAVGVVQKIDANVGGFQRLALSLDVRVSHHTLLNAGWWAETRGGSGEYPVKVLLYYKDAKGESYVWTHGFISEFRSQPVRYRDPKTGDIEYHDAGTNLTNFTKVPRDKWYHYEVNLMDSRELIDMDFSRRGRQMPKPARLTAIKVFGQGWDFAAAVDNIELRGGE
ncbi:MAG: hypothetical protein JSV16_15430 [Candidatus Hydrogenedentota bacterium]|nr:MAG: hypothetical protein JSV16_15430 [Candidatus Hydrogenedentota bacterium]